MPKTVEERIEDLLDQLEGQNLTEREIERIEKKIKILRSQHNEQ